jgi:sugar-specific transcriptional regulator TrmB
MLKPNYYAVIPADVRYNKKLSPNSKLLYAEITALCNMNGKCTASTQYFATLYNVSKTSIQNWLKCLDDNKFITRHTIFKEGTKEILSRHIKLVKRSTQNKFRDNTNINITNTNLTDSNKKALFKKPTLDEVKNYCILRKNNVDAEAFIDFYESKNFMIGKNKMKDWKAAVRTWERRDKEKQSMGKLHSQINAWQEAKKLL